MRQTSTEGTGGKGEKKEKAESKKAKPAKKGGGGEDVRDRPTAEELGGKKLVEGLRSSVRDRRELLEG